MSLGLLPWSQALSQKEFLSPLPTMIVVAAANSCLSLVVHGVSDCNHCPISILHCFQSQRRLKARENFPK